MSGYLFSPEIDFDMTENVTLRCCVIFFYR